MLALIAGTGALPSHLARAVPKPPLVARIAGTRLEGLDHDCEFVLEDIAGFLAFLKTQGVSEVCFAGGTRRPEFRAERVTPESRPYVARLLAAMEKGDGGALSILLGIFEDAGFRIRAAQDIARPFFISVAKCQSAWPPDFCKNSASNV